MKRRNFSNFVTPLFLVMTAAMLMMAIISLWWNWVVFVVELLISAAALGVVIFSIINFKKYLAHTISQAMKAINENDSKTIERINMPVAIIGENNEIVAANSLFINNISGGTRPDGDLISEYLPKNSVEKLFGKNGVDTLRNDRWYIAFAVKNGESAAVYFIEDTAYKKNSDEYKESRPVVAIISFDNKEELERDNGDGEASRIAVLIEKEIVSWVSSTTGFYKKINNGRYLVVMEERYIKKSIDEKFKILEKVREIKVNDRINASISIGIGRGASSFKESEAWARQALDMALGRGGDQAAVKKSESYQFFGGVSKGVEKHDKVRTRVIAATLTNHINISSNILIMGHRFSDLDCVGAAIGMWSACVKGLHKNAYIVINRQQSLAKPLIATFEKAGFESIFKTEDEALDLIDSHTLLIIVDTHSPNLVESREVYEKCKKVVVIDHHRMMVNHIDNAVVSYHEPYASSACEMTTELVQYLGTESLSRLESEALLAGITLDTKNFVLRTGVRTFEAAAFLRSKGADTVEVKRLFSNSIDTYKVKYKLVSDAEIFNYCAIACADENVNDIKIASAQAADELLGIENVKASFVMYKSGKTVNISARSLGDVNVQLIMEALGGGGHHTMAACQMEDVSIAEAREKLVSIVNDLVINKPAKN